MCHYKYYVHIWILCVYLQRGCWEMWRLQQTVRAQCSAKHLLQLEWSNRKTSCIIKQSCFSSVVCGQWPNPYILKIFICPTLYMYASTDGQVSCCTRPWVDVISNGKGQHFLSTPTPSKQLCDLGPHHRWLPEVGGRFCADRHCLVLLIISIQDLFHFRGL